MGLKLGFIKFSFFVLIYIGNDDILIEDLFIVDYIYLNININ